MISNNRRIHAFDLNRLETKLPIARGAPILTILCEDGKVKLYTMMFDLKPSVFRKFICCFEGDLIESDREVAYVGSVRVPIERDGVFVDEVRHYFEVC